MTFSLLIGFVLLFFRFLGQCKQDKDNPRPFMNTLTGQKLPGIFQSVTAAHAHYVTSVKVNLFNGDSCSTGQHVIVQRHSGSSLVGSPFIACVHEIVQQVGSTNHDNGQPDGLLLQSLAHDETSERLQMPRLRLQDEWSFVSLSVTCIFSYIL